VGIELREHHRRHQRVLKRHAGTLQELYSNLCELDAGVVREAGTCSVCHRQVKEAKPDFVQPPDMSDEQPRRKKHSGSESKASVGSVRRRRPPGPRRNEPRRPSQENATSQKHSTAAATCAGKHQQPERGD